MVKLNLNEIKAQLSKYVEMVEAGEVVVICKRNVPVAEIRALVPQEKKKPELGWADGQFALSTAFDDVSDAEPSVWEGDEQDPLRKYAPKS